LLILRFQSKNYILDKPFNFILKEEILDSIPKGCILLKPVIAGICGSDMLYFKGRKEKLKLKQRLPMPLLHEGVAEIVDLGEGVQLKIGDHVVVNPMIPCGECVACKNSQTNFCQSSKYMASTAYGLARTYFIYPSDRVISVPPEVELEVAALTEPLSIALNAVEVSEIRLNDYVAIIGDGIVGYLTALTASYIMGFPKDRIYLVGIVNEKLSLAKDFATQVNSISEDIKSLENKFDLIFEAVGGSSHKNTIKEAVDMTKPGGRIILLGLSKGNIPVEIIKIVNKGLTIKGSTRSKMEHYKKVLKMLRNSEFKTKVKRIISKKKFNILSVEDLNVAFRYADTEEGEAKTKPGRVLVHFPQ
jgi:ribitol-5-phosphate 2-dehydrogenase